MARGDVKKVGGSFQTISRRVSPTTKRPKPSANPIYSPAGQFGGVLNGRPGDPRK